MKGMEMMKRFFQRILGVPSGTVEGGAVWRPSLVSQKPVPVLYKPESELTEQAIQGVADDGSCWAFWRVDADGQRWYQRISADSPTPTILAIDAADDDDELEASGDDLDPIEAFRRETAILKSRYERGEIGDLYGNDEAGTFDDED